MNELVTEWIKKAESDYLVAQHELSLAEPRTLEAVCFHAQQCVEKYAKAFLTEHDVEFEYTHNMLYLHRKCVEVDAEFKKYEKEFDILDDYAVDIRYPGISVRAEDAKEAFEIAKRLRAFIRSKLNLPEDSLKEGNESEK
ncbi:MAG: HEPN domain-containing protein [Chloroflexi bacterium]|nr:HEPN domain-containing protein [Chloroflexota bacterium]